MKYTLYVGEDCHDCDHVEKALRKRQDIEVINVDTDQKDQPPSPIFIRPALFEGQDLKAYGVDILDILKD